MPHHCYLALGPMSKVGVKFKSAQKLTNAAQKEAFSGPPTDCQNTPRSSTAKGDNCKFVAKKSHYHVMVFVCVSVISVDVVDQILIFKWRL